MDSKVTDTLLPFEGEIDLGGKTLKIIKRLGGGLTSEVYQGELIAEGSPPVSVAVKAMKALDFPTARQAFEQESLTLAMLMHLEQERAKNDNAVLTKLNLVAPKIAPIYYGKGDYNGTPFIVMEFIRGSTIIDILDKKGKLSEPQALTASWHLYRILDVLHTELNKSFIDLKFENLWWMSLDDKGAGQLKLTDFGTLEEIKLPNSRGIRRDILLAAVYLFAMLTGHTLKYSLGELQERAEPLLNANDDVMSWGTHQILRRLVHRNPDQRPESAKSVANELQNLLSFWNGGPQILKDAEDRLNLAETRKEREPEKVGNLARLARSALDIVPKLGQPYDQERLELDIRRADEILAQSDYLERSKNLFSGRAYDLALETLEKGIKWSDDPAPMRRLAYLCMAGKVVPTNLFDSNKDSVLMALDLINVGRWKDASERIEGLKSVLGSSGFEALRADCILFGKISDAEQLRSEEKFAESANAYRQAMATLETLPYKDIIKTEEVGDLLSTAQEMESKDRTRGEARRLIDEAKSTFLGGDHSGALLKAREAFVRDRENADLLPNLNELASLALANQEYGLAIQFIELGMHLPHLPDELMNTLALVRLLKSAEQARRNRDRQTFFSALREVQLKYIQDSNAANAMKKLLEEAEEWAIRTSEIAFLNSLANFYVDELKDAQHAEALRSTSRLASSEQSKQREADVDRLLAEVVSIFYSDRPEYGKDAAARWTAAEFIAKIQHRRKALEDALKMGNDALTIARPIHYKLDDVEKWITWLEQVLETFNESQTSQQKADVERLTELQSRWSEVSALHGNEKATALKEFLYQVYRYLYEIDGASEPALQLKGQALQACDRFGQKGWLDIQTLSTRRLDEIRTQFSDAELGFKNGDLAKTIAELERLLPLYGDADEWMLLKVKVFHTMSWMSWLKDNAQKLQIGQVDPAILALLRQYQGYQIPSVYWRNSAVFPYLKTARGNALQDLKQANINQRDEYLDALAALLNVDWTDRMLRGEIDKLQNWDSSIILKFVRSIVKGNIEGGMGAVERILSGTQPPANVDEVLNHLKPESWVSVIREAGGTQRKSFPLGKTALISAAMVFMMIYLCITVGAVGYCYFNQTYCRDSIVQPNTIVVHVTQPPKLMTVVVPGPTAPPFTPEPTRPLPTAFPVSRSYVTRPETIYPPIPVNGREVWLLDDKDLFTPAGAGLFNSDVWSASVSADPDANKEPFYYTEIGGQFVSWIMDTTLYDGIYQLYVTDTMKQSAGAQMFLVKKNGVPVEPYLGQSTVIFASEKQQSSDDWISIGAYELKTGDHLIVSIAIGPRTIQEPFAVDRLLIEKIPENELRMLDFLPQGRPLVSLMDDDRTNYDTKPEKDHWAHFTDSPAWNGSYIARADKRPEDVNLIWRSLGVLSSGKYQVFVWLPDKNTTINIAEYTFLADGKPAPRPAPAKIDQNKVKGWVDLGLWTLENPAAVSINLNVKPDAQGNIGADAVAIMRAGDVEPAPQTLVPGATPIPNPPPANPPTNPPAQ